jgi:hypothetical protein
LPELQGLIVEILVLAKLAGILKVGNLSLDGSKIHADASKSKAVSYGRRVELEKQLQDEGKRLFELGEQAQSENSTNTDYDQHYNAQVAVLASSKKFSAFASFLCVAWQILLGNGVLCAWRSI